MARGDDTDIRLALLDWAESGVVALTGHSDGPPLVPPGHAATTARGLTTRIGELTRGRVALDGAQLLAERAAVTGHARRGRVAPGGSCRLLPTADGWAAVSYPRPDDLLLLGALAETDLHADPWPAIAAWLRGHRGEQLAGRAELLGVPGTPVLLRGQPTGFARHSPRSVTGLLVVDFSALWAGPLCAHILGLAGARVVKVETPTRPDGARRGNHEFYHLLHAGHRSVVLDPTTRAGRAAMSALVASADIVIEGSRPRALEGFGLDASTAVANGTTWISITAAGRSSHRVGFGDDVAAGAGLVALDAGGAPVFCGDAIADPLTGLTAAALALTAPSNGSGVLWDVAMAHVVAATIDPAAEPRPAQAARRDARGWVVDTPDGPVAVAAPRRRRPAGTAPDTGAGTAQVLAELGIPLP